MPAVVRFAGVDFRFGNLSKDVFEDANNRLKRVMVVAEGFRDDKNVKDIGDIFKAQ